MSQAPLPQHRAIVAICSYLATTFIQDEGHAMMLGALKEAIEAGGSYPAPLKPVVSAAVHYLKNSGPNREHYLRQAVHDYHRQAAGVFLDVMRGKA